jgi:hypothetical protein
MVPRDGVQALLLLHSTLLLLLVQPSSIVLGLFLLCVMIFICRMKTIILLEPLFHSTVIQVVLLLAPPLPRLFLQGCGDLVRWLEACVL